MKIRLFFFSNFLFSIVLCATSGIFCSEIITEKLQITSNPFVDFVNSRQISSIFGVDMTVFKNFPELNHLLCVRELNTNFSSLLRNFTPASLKVIVINFIYVLFNENFPYYRSFVLSSLALKNLGKSLQFLFVSFHCFSPEELTPVTCVFTKERFNAGKFVWEAFSSNLFNIFQTFAKSNQFFNFLFFKDFFVTMSVWPSFDLIHLYIRIYRSTFISDKKTSILESNDPDIIDSYLIKLLVGHPNKTSITMTFRRIDCSAAAKSENRLCHIINYLSLQTTFNLFNETALEIENLYYKNSNQAALEEWKLMLENYRLFLNLGRVFMSQTSDGLIYPAVMPLKNHIGRLVSTIRNQFVKAFYEQSIDNLVISDFELIEKSKIVFNNLFVEPLKIPEIFSVCSSVQSDYLQIFKKAFTSSDPESFEKYAIALTNENFWKDSLDKYIKKNTILKEFKVNFSTELFECSSQLKNIKIIGDKSLIDINLNIPTDSASKIVIKISNLLKTINDKVSLASNIDLAHIHAVLQLILKIYFDAQIISFKVTEKIIIQMTNSMENKIKSKSKHQIYEISSSNLLKLIDEIIECESSNWITEAISTNSSLNNYLENRIIREKMSIRYLIQNSCLNSGLVSLLQLPFSLNIFNIIQRLIFISYETSLDVNTATNKENEFSDFNPRLFPCKSSIESFFSLLIEKNRLIIISRIHMILTGKSDFCHINWSQSEIWNAVETSYRIFFHTFIPSNKNSTFFVYLLENISKMHPSLNQDLFNSVMGYFTPDGPCVYPDKVEILIKAIINLDKKLWLFSIATMKKKKITDHEEIISSYEELVKLIKSEKFTSIKPIFTNDIKSVDSLVEIIIDIVETLNDICNEKIKEKNLEEFQEFTIIDLNNIIYKCFSITHPIPCLNWIYSKIISFSQAINVAPNRITSILPSILSGINYFLQNISFNNVLDYFGLIIPENITFNEFISRLISDKFDSLTLDSIYNFDAEEFCRLFLLLFIKLQYFKEGFLLIDLIWSLFKIDNLDDKNYEYYKIGFLTNLCTISEFINDNWRFKLNEANEPISKDSSSQFLTNNLKIFIDNFVNSLITAGNHIKTSPKSYPILKLFQSYKHRDIQLTSKSIDVREIFEEPQFTWTTQLQDKFRIYWEENRTRLKKYNCCPNKIVSKTLKDIAKPYDPSKISDESTKSTKNFENVTYGQSNMAILSESSSLSVDDSIAVDQQLIQPHGILEISKEVEIRKTEIRSESPSVDSKPKTKSRFKSFRENIAKTLKLGKNKHSTNPSSEGKKP